MFAANLPVLTRMLLDPRLRSSVLDTHRLLSSDPSYSRSKLISLLSRLLRDERVVEHDDVYVISSFLPPWPTPALTSFLNATRAPGAPFSQLARAARRAPLSVNLALTDRCVYRCRHCSAHTLRAPTRELSGAEWTEVVRALQEMGTSYLGFTGGEPLLRDDLEQIISAVDQRSTTILFTNGRGLTAARAKALKACGLFALSVSLDSADAEIHDRRRGAAGASSDALAAIRNSARAGLYTLVQAVVFRRELDERSLFELFRLVRRNGAHEIRIHQPVPSGLLNQDDDDGEIFFEAQDRRRLLRLQRRANRTLSGFPKVSSFPHTEGPEKFGCTAGVFHSYISASGELCPCDFVPLSFGNVREVELSAAWREMNQAVGGPRLSCWAIPLAPALRGESLPLDREAATRLCHLHRPTEAAAFFRQLGD